MGKTLPKRYTNIRIVEVVYATIGALIFSLYIIFDTYNICNVLHPDEYIVGAVNLYHLLP